MQSDGWAPELSSPRRRPPVGPVGPSADSVLLELRRSPALDMTSPYAILQPPEAAPVLPVQPIAPQLRYHPQCQQCCAVQRCHWCATKPGPILILQPARDEAEAGPVAYHACQAHADLFESSMELLPGVNPHLLGANCLVRPEGFALVRPLIS